MLAIQLMRLTQQSREAAVIAERNRMARDMHDTLAQGFTGVIMQLEAAKGAMASADASSVSAHIERAEALARSSLGEAAPLGSRDAFAFAGGRHAFHRAQRIAATRDRRNGVAG